MPWIGISFDDSRVKNLKEFYNVRAIPSLILVDSKGEVVENDCRADVYALGEDDAYVKWKKLRDMQDKEEVEVVEQDEQKV
jgi:thioredoxin-related protein